jgi:hypothetical protein
VGGIRIKGWQEDTSLTHGFQAAFNIFNLTEQNTLIMLKTFGKTGI